MRSHSGHLDFGNLIIFLANMLKILFPMQVHHRMIILIQKQESGISVNDRLYLGIYPVFYNSSEALCHFRRHWNLPHSAFGFRLHYPIANSGIALKLMIYMDLHIFEINIQFGKPYKFGYSQTSIK